MTTLTIAVEVTLLSIVEVSTAATTVGASIIRTVVRAVVLLLMILLLVVVTCCLVVRLNTKMGWDTLEPLGSCPNNTVFGLRKCSQPKTKVRSPRPIPPGRSCRHVDLRVPGIENS